MEEKILTWEELKKKENNPWTEIFDKDTEVLRKMILSGTAEFVHPDEADIIKGRNKTLEEKGKYHKILRLFLLPKPYRGNLKDPKLVILSLNPGYKERVKKTLFEMLHPEFQRIFIETSKDNALLKEGCRIISNEVDDVMDNGYWSDKLSELKLLNDSYLSKIGLIQFIPYASEKYDKHWNKEDIWRTQRFSIDIIRYLLHKTDTLFLVMRSQKQWEKLLYTEMNDENFKDRFLYNKNPICQKISEKNLKNEDMEIQNQYQRILKALNK